MKKIIQIDSELHHVTKLHAYKLGDTLSGFIEKSIKYYIENTRDKTDGISPISIVINQAQQGRPRVKKQTVKRWHIENKLLELELRGDFIPLIADNAGIKEGDILDVKLHREDICYMPDNNLAAVLMLIFTCDSDNPYVVEPQDALRIMEFDGETNIVEVHQLDADPGDMDIFEPVNELAHMLIKLPCYPRKNFSKYFLYGLNKAGLFIKYS